jgi:thioredoxin 1
MTEEIKSIEQLNSLIKNKTGLAVYFSSPACGVCSVLKPKVEEMFAKEFPLITFVEVKNDLSPEIAGQNKVFAAPTLLVYLDRKEFLRSVRNMSISQLTSKIKRPYNMLTSND